MKNSRFALLLPLFLLPLVLRAGDVSSQIRAVTVYADRAVVSREASAELEAGVNELVFPELPAALFDQSLQVSGAGTAAATILDVTARQTFLAATPDPRRHELERQIAALQDQDRALVDRATVLRGQSDLISRLQGSAVALGAGEHSERPKLDDVKSVLAYGQQQLLDIAASLQKLDQQRADLQDQITALQNQLNELRDPGRRSVKAVTVRVSAPQAGSLRLTLSYTVPGASWTPGYDARVQTGENTVQLAYFGNVRQHTGEDWKDVALTLSTARPSLGGAAPELDLWALDVLQPRPVELPAVRAESAMKEELMRANALAMKDKAQFAATGAMRDAALAQASVDLAATSATFRIAAPASVASDNSVQKVPVTTADLKAALTYATTPKLREAAFLNAKVINASDFPLLAGALNVFLDGTFVATSRLDTTMPGEKFDLALGADEGISVKRQRVQKFAEENGVFSKTHRLTYEYRITVQNNKRTAARVVVHDQVPVSRNEKIVVKVLAPEAKDARPDEEGKLTWSLDLKPGEKRELAVKFTIDYPADVQVEGLE